MGLSPFLRKKIARHSNLHKILVNTGWLFGDKVLRMGVGLVVGVWVARYLGPEQFGLLNYAGAFVALFVPFATLGLNGIVVRDLVQDPPKADVTMGAAFALTFLGGLGACCLSGAAIGYARPDDDLAKSIVVLLSLSMIFKASDVVRYWFEAQVQSKYVVSMENGVFLAVSAVKIGLILAHAPLVAFVWTLFAEALIVAVGLLAVYAWRGGKLTAWRCTVNRAGVLLKDSWPLILSGLATMFYMRIDQVMLGQMLADESVGIYSAAVRVSEVWYFIPMSIVASVFPSIIEAKKTSDALYAQRLQKLFDVMVVLALTVALPMTFFSGWVVDVLFGSAYRQAASVLSVHIWAGVFVFLGVASGNWFLVEGLQRYSFYRTVLGAVVNIGLNLWMIPKYGAIGAAYATVVSFAVAALFADLLKKETRPVFGMKIRSLNVLKTMVSIWRYRD